MTRKIILVAQAPGPRGAKQPLAGAAGRRLAALAGLDLPDFLARFEGVNLLPGGGPHKGDRLDLAAARERADQLREGWRGRKAVLLGRAVQTAFRLLPEDASWFQAVEIPPGVEVVVIPQPGGNANWWNDAENTERAREFMRRLNIGFLAAPKRRGKERFAVEEIKAALEAGRGVYTWAAEALAEVSGTSCCADTIKSYVRRYPEDLNPVLARSRASLAGTVVKGIIAKAEAGDMAALKELAGMKFVQDIARAALDIDLRKHVAVDGDLRHHHSGTIIHERSAADLARMSPQEVVAAYRELIAEDDGTTRH